MIPAGFAAGRTLDVDDPDHLSGHVGNAAMAAGLEQHDMAARDELPHQRIHIGLEQRLAARDLDIVAADGRHLRHHVVDADLVAFVEGVRRVAPGASEIARRQADEDARPARVRGLALNGVEDLVEREHRLFDCDESGPRNAVRIR